MLSVPYPVLKSHSPIFRVLTVFMTTLLGMANRIVGGWHTPINSDVSFDRTLVDGYVLGELPIDRVVLVGRLLVVGRRANVDDVARHFKASCWQRSLWRDPCFLAELPSIGSPMILSGITSNSGLRPYSVVDRDLPSYRR